MNVWLLWRFSLIAVWLLCYSYLTKDKPQLSSLRWRTTIWLLLLDLIVIENIVTESFNV